ncbi:MAG: hypothetical protein LUH54_01925 [Firmicutes bacterium]|nr:hypothetical protein [Bacillota bacterium]
MYSVACFNIVEEYTTIDLGKYYTVICADYDGVVRSADEFTYMYGDFNIKRFESYEVRSGFLTHECSKLERIIKGKSTSKIDTSHEKYMLDKLYELLRKE